MICLLFKIKTEPMLKFFWLVGLSVVLQLAVPAHAHDDLDHNSGAAKQYHVCALCSLDQPPKALGAFDAPQINVRVRGPVQYAKDHSADSSQLHLVRPPARAPPSQT